MAAGTGRNGRLRLLLMELAVVLPAIGLIAFSILHLKSIQRDRAVEAAIQRDFSQVLAITDKTMATEAHEMIDPARAQFPRPGQPVEPMLQRVLAGNPWAAYALVFDKDAGTTLILQPGRSADPVYREEASRMKTMVNGWFALEGKEILEKIRKMGKQEDGHPYLYDSDWHTHPGGRDYVSVVFFPIPGVAEDRVTLGGIAFDPEYLKDDFFPRMLNSMAACPTNKMSKENDQNRAALLLHPKKDSQVVAASANWDGGKAEVERPLEAAFPGLVLAIKYRGTTIEALSGRFLRTSYLILGAISLLLAGGIYMTYRSVNREVALAKLKSDFVSNVSHELRTPLSLIRLYAETLEMGRLTQTEKYQEYYRIIRKESERLTALINNILDFSRIEAGKKEYEFRPTDLADLVRATLDSYRYQIEQNGFMVEERIEDDLPPVNVDREAIARSLVNLVNNAVKYSADNKYLGVNLYRDNGSVKVEVVDRGIGIARMEQGKIFDKFYRVCDPLVHNTKGSGLGLSLVRHVMQAHGGEVRVDSWPGEGSKFTMILPVDAQARTANAELTGKGASTS